MKTIKSIDLWTEKYGNHYECFNDGILQNWYNSIGIRSTRIDMNDVYAETF